MLPPAAFRKIPPAAAATSPFVGSAAPSASASRLARRRLPPEPSSTRPALSLLARTTVLLKVGAPPPVASPLPIGRSPGRGRGRQSAYIWVVHVDLKKNKP